MTDIDSGRFDEGTRVAIIKVMQRAYDRLLDEHDHETTWRLLETLGIEVGSYRLRIDYYDLDNVERAWVQDLAKHIALGNRPGIY